jgi:hypothetical protein
MENSFDEYFSLYKGTNDKISLIVLLFLKRTKVLG